MESFGLAKYEEAKRALAACVRIDEVKDIQDKSEAMRLYARMSENTDLEVYASTIKLRAQVRLGGIIADMPKASNQVACPTAGTMGKRAALSDAGISKSSANRYEQIASIPATVLESYIARKTAAREPVSLAEVVSIARPPKSKAAPDTAADRQHALEYLPMTEEQWCAAMVGCNEWARLNGRPFQTDEELAAENELPLEMVLAASGAYNDLPE